MKKVFKQDGQRQMIVFEDLTEMSFTDYRKSIKSKKPKKEIVILKEASDLLDLIEED